ncbi:alpha-galactosidase [Streptomyces sp. CA2R106]|uniref:alpha-galactosidase n=1 Tax=Streptomyces sp. CA2R106 TaxID=3120153 RepID=UPI0030086512
MAETAVPGFAEPARLWADARHAAAVLGAQAGLLTEGARLAVEPGPAGARQLRLSAAADTTAVLRLDVPLGDAAGYWHPSAGWDRHLTADWASRWRTVGPAESAPLGCLYDTAGRALLAFGADRPAATTRVRFGLAEDTARFGVWLAVELRAGESCRVVLQPAGSPVAAAVRALGAALAVPDALPVPPAGREPAYSTWYAMHRDVGAADVEAEAKLAAAAGCGVLLLDDGWQLHAKGTGYSGSGDWTPDPAKFPDFAAHVRTVQGLGLRYMAWIAPLIVGERTAAHRKFAHLAPHAIPRLGCRVLDPRLAAAREVAADACVELVRRHHLDGLKIDFLDLAAAYADLDPVGGTGAAGRDDGTGAGGGASAECGTGAATAPGSTPSGGGDGGDAGGIGGAGDVADVGEGLRLLLADVRDRLRALRGDDLLVELRQPYTGPGMLAFGNLLRAADCPGDATANRVRTLDLGLLATSGAVHSDMLMWDRSATPQTAARQLHSALFATPQLSVALAGLPADQHAATVFWLDFWRSHRDVLTGGLIDAGRPDQLHPTVTAQLGQRAVAAFFAEHTHARLPLAGRTETALVNSTAADRVVLDVEGAATAVRLDTFDACGRPAGSHLRTLGPGPAAIAVPPAGLCVVRPA